MIVVCSLANYTRVNEESLKETFKGCGAIKDVKIFEDRHHDFTGQGKIEFLTTEAAEKAVFKFNGKKVLEKNIGVMKWSTDPTKLYTGKEAPHKKRRLSKHKKKFKGDSDEINDIDKRVFVGGLPFTATKESVKDYFKDFGGGPEKVVIPEGKKGPLGMAYVYFKDKESAVSSVKLNGEKFTGSKRWVKVTHYNTLKKEE